MVDSATEPRMTLAQQTEASRIAHLRAATEHIDAALVEARALRLEVPTRERSLAITKLEEARLWLMADDLGLFPR